MKYSFKKPTTRFKEHKMTFLKLNEVNKNTLNNNMFEIVNFLPHRNNIQEASNENGVR